MKKRKQYFNKIMTEYDQQDKYDFTKFKETINNIFNDAEDNHELDILLMIYYEELEWRNYSFISNNHFNKSIKCNDPLIDEKTNRFNDEKNKSNEIARHIIRELFNDDDFYKMEKLNKNNSARVEFDNHFKNYYHGGNIDSFRRDIFYIIDTSTDISNLIKIMEHKHDLLEQLIAKKYEKVKSALNDIDVATINYNNISLYRKSLFRRKSKCSRKCLHKKLIDAKSHYKEVNDKHLTSYAMYNSLYALISELKEQKEQETREQE